MEACIVARERSCRLFFALWPPDGWRDEIARQVRPRVDSGRGRAVPSANFHVTLAFLGEVLQSLVGRALSAGAKTAGGPFDLSLDRIEFWTGSNLLCLTATQVPPALLVLADRLRFNLLEQQFRLRPGRFRPHVTLLRDAPRIGPVPIAPVQWRVDDFVLVESELGRSGSKYSVLARWPLQSVDAGP